MKCTNSTSKEKCKTDDETEAFLKSIYFTMYTIDSKVSYDQDTDHGYDPTFYSGVIRVRD